MKRAEADYHSWREMIVEAGGATVRAATKPGVAASGDIDPAISLLTAEVELARGENALIMNGGGGGGILASLLARHAGRIWMSDRNVVAFEATRRTLLLNGISNATASLTHGTVGFPKDLQAQVAVIRIPHEKLPLLQLMGDAFAAISLGGRCYIGGATTEGIKSAARLLEKLFGNAEVLVTKSGHRVALARKETSEHGMLEELSSPYLSGDAFNLLRVTLRDEPYELYTRPGIFSWEHLDEATEMLARAMEIRRGDSVLDLGCGAGALGLVAGKLSNGAPVTMLDADVEAVRSAQRSAEAARLPNARVLASDIAEAVRGELFDVVVTNPPFHIGKATDLDLPLQFIRDSHEVLHPDGRLYLVANRTLPYERAIEREFGSVELIQDGRRFKVLSATKRLL